jgi:kynurenine formamidase
MKIIDLSHLICSGMPVYSETESPELQPICTLGEDGYRETKITLYSHTGTHIDAPGHMINNGIYLDHIGIEYFIGKATILDFSNGKKPLLNPDDFNPEYINRISKVDFVIIKTLWGKYWGKNEYFQNYPYLSTESARFLAGYKLKGVGIDTMSLEPPDTVHFYAHKILLSKNILIIENLTNLELIKSDFFTFLALPLKIKDSDGSPVRALALENL